MVVFLEEKLKVERQGRLVLPSQLRERLGLGGKGCAVSVRLDGSNERCRLISRSVSKT